MSRKRMAAILMCVSLGLSIILAGCGTNATPNEAPSQGNTASNGSDTHAQVVHVIATDWKWKLDRTTFSTGQPIEFDITSKEGIHGFSIDGTSISKDVTPGKQIHVIWTPPKAGKYIIRCNVYCGSGHDHMFTSFTVR